MAAYARIYGFQVVDGKHIEGREEEFTCLGGNCYLSNGEYEMLEEIIEQEFYLEKTDHDYNNRIYG